MIANVQQTATTSFYQVREKQVAKPSTYKQRVMADRIVMLLMLVTTIVLAVVTA